jgi:prepilin-type N-terminal cleavage/methylation domain-containing protein/prepilin-type processing-associated H-X9-DG protein
MYLKNQRSTQMTLNHTFRKQGFTLIELLVVIAIIAILASILFPVFARARENARRSSCQSNLKQIGLGIMQYTQDYDEKFPSVAPGLADVDLYAEPGVIDTRPSIQACVQPYIKSWQIFRCPSATEGSGAGLAPVGNSATSYVTNGVLIRNGGVSIAAIPESAALIAMQERKWVYRIASHDPQRVPYNSNNYQYWLYTAGGYSNVHFDGGNLLFADGHAKWRRTVSISAREFGLNSDALGAQPDSAAAICEDWAKI